MEFTGRFEGLMSDNSTGRQKVSLSVNEDARGSFEELKGCDLSITIKKYRKKRSLNANAYFHVLCCKIADKMQISKPRCKNILISRYGQPEILDDGEQAVLKTNISVSKMLEQESLHCIPCGAKIENGLEVNFFRVYRGSHTYDTKEMSILIDGTIQEAKEIGIPDSDIATPDEKRLLKEKYGVEL